MKMSAECPQGTCVGLEDIKKELPDKVDRKITTKWIIALIGYSVTIIIILGVAWGKAKDERNENKKDIAVMSQAIKDGFEHMSEKLDNMQASQRRIWQKLNHNE